MVSFVINPQPRNAMRFPSLHFDRQDHELLALINQTIDQDREDRAQFFANLHPNGIIGLAVPGELRMASAVLHLLDTLKQGREEERLQALQTLRDEVLVSARTTLRHNTGRVLIQIMKELVRAHGDETRQLKLAHDFRQAATGKPSVVRRLLRRYYLLEMPETWNQAVFDHHVHDANTKGRKNATHLIMDAWVKGIRSLTVIYYNYVAPEAARELLRAAEIMGVTLRIGLLFHAPFRGRLVDFIWIPRGFSDAEGFLAFLAEPPVRRLMEEGRKATRWMEARVLRMLDRWNETDRLELAEELETTPVPLRHDDFLTFVGSGQASLLHLAEFIHRNLLPLLERRAAELRRAMRDAPPDTEKFRAMRQRLLRLDSLTSEAILERLSSPERNPELNAFHTAPTDPDCPEILRLAPILLLDWLTGLHSGNRVILNLAELTPEDVLNLLWDCQGLITHLELFNLKDWQEGKASHIKAINELQLAINDGSAPRLKQIIRGMIRNSLAASDLPADASETGAEEQSRTERKAADLGHALPDPDKRTAVPPIRLENAASRQAGAPRPDGAARAAKLRLILRNIPVLQDFYKKTKLYTRMGTDSTSRPGRRYGMGLAFPETLPPRARKELREPTNTSRLRLPLRTELLERLTYRSGTGEDTPSAFTRLLRRLPGCRRFGQHREKDWIPVQEHTIVCNNGMCSTDTASDSPHLGNVVTLGGIGRVGTNGFCPEQADRADETAGTRYINTKLANWIKALAGFLPALLAFQLTQDHWVLAWLGAPLWYLITGLRNILQAVLGGGGLRRSPLLRWNNYVSWSRLCDSLMYTGFSVVLLELILRLWVLEDVFSITSANNALLTFSIISLVNGFYIAGHNFLRGLQREAIIGNLFRSVFAIPVSMGYNWLIEGLLVLCSVGDPAVVMLSSAAIISKVGSDTVAGVIEGVADRNSNVRLRRLDYRSKLAQVFSTYGRLELLFPERGVLEMLTRPKELLDDLSRENRELRVALITNALDLMYFWFYQPRSADALRDTVRHLSGAERLVLLRSQRVLKREQEVSQLFVDGLVGRSFARALSFYLDRHKEYLRDMEAVCLERRPYQK